MKSKKLSAKIELEEEDGSQKGEIKGYLKKNNISTFYKIIQMLRGFEDGKYIESEKEKRIIVEFDDGESEIEVEYGSFTFEFKMKSNDKRKIISEINKRTGISSARIKKIITFKEDD